MAFCKYCGSRVQDNAVFCSNCGQRLSGPAQGAQYPPPPEPERQWAETAEQRAQRYRNGSYQNNAGNANTGGNGGPAAKNSSMKIVIPVALAAFIAVTLLINSVSNRSSGRKEYVPPTPPAISISIPPLFNVKPTIELPESPPEPTAEAGYDQEEFFESIGDSVLVVLKAITERSDYTLGAFEPLIGVTDVNENGHAEILAVYEANNNGSYQVMYDVWSTDSRFTGRVMNGVLFYEIGGNGGVVHLLQDASGAPYVMLEQSTVSGEYFQVTFDLYKFSSDETTVDYYGAWKSSGRYDTENGGIAEAKYYMMQSDWAELSAADFEQSLNAYTITYSLDIISGEYDWDNTLSFDWAWKAFGQEP